MDYVIGLDLGQKSDYTAVAVLETKRQPGTHKKLLHLRHLERYPLGTPYGGMMDTVAGLVEEVKERVRAKLPKPVGVSWEGPNPPRPPAPYVEQPDLVVDSTGVGVGVVEMLKERGLRYKAVSITGGDSTARGSDGVWRVPKRELISRAVAVFEGGRLKIARSMPLVGELTKELQNFRVKVNISTAHDSYEAWRERDHDDLVLALALACWWAERGSGGVVLTRKPDWA